MKRILIIANLYPSEFDPSYGTFVKKFADELEDYFPSYTLDRCVIRGRPTSEITKIKKYISLYICTFFKLLLYKYDLIYIHYISFSIPPVLLVSKFKKLQLAFNIHGDDLLFKNRKGKFFLKMAIPLLCKAKMNVVPSSFFKDILKQRIPDVPLENVVISPSGGINESFFVKYNGDEKDEQCLKLGYVSRIDNGKGWDVFIKTISLLKEKGHQVIAYIVGTGKQLDELNCMISNSGLQDVVFYLGAKSHDELPSFYQQLDLFVFPTLLPESLGLVGLEAMAASVPVVGSEIGGLKTYIRNGENGYLFEAGNEIDLYEKILEYIALNPDKRIRMREAAYNTAIQYEEKLIAQKLFEKISETYKLDD